MKVLKKVIGCCLIGLPLSIPIIIAIAIRDWRPAVITYVATALIFGSIALGVHLVNKN